MSVSVHAFATAITDTTLLLRRVSTFSRACNPMGVALLSPLRAFSKASIVSISPSTCPAIARGAVPSSASLSGLSGLRTPQPYGCGVLGGSASWAVRRVSKTINLVRTHVGATAAYSQQGYNAQGYDAPSYGGSSSPVPEEVAWDKDLVNNVSMIGRLGRDPMLRVIGNNMTVADTSLAVARATKAGANKEVDWVTLTFWNELAVQAKDHLSQGQQVHVQGRLRQDSWQDKNTGQTRTSLKLTVIALHRVRSDKFPDNTARPGLPDRSYGAQNTNYSNQSNQWPSEPARSQPPSAPQYDYPAASKSFQPASDQKPFSEAERSYQTNTFKQQYAPNPNASDTENPKSAKMHKTEADWKSCLAEPNRWWDNRLMKKNTKAPDFKHKDTGDALWLNGYDTPVWVHQELNNLGSTPGGAGDSYSAPSSSPPSPLYGGNEPFAEDPPF